MRGFSVSRLAKLAPRLAPRLQAPALVTWDATGQTIFYDYDTRTDSERRRDEVRRRFGCLSFNGFACDVASDIDPAELMAAAWQCGAMALRALSAVMGAEGNSEAFGMLADRADELDALSTLDLSEGFLLPGNCPPGDWQARYQWAIDHFQGYGPQGTSEARNPLWRWEALR